MNKKIACSALLSVTALFIVLPVIRSVNIPAGNPVLAAPSAIAEGDPMPPPHRPCCSLVPEGDPMPPPHRPGVAVISEGDPMPPPHRPGLAV
jgi:hypothetical protein